MNRDMTTTRLSLLLPVRLPADAGVKALLFNGPSNEQHRALALLGFTQFGYSDERLGRVGTLDEATTVNEEHSNRFWKTQIIGDNVRGEVIGDLIAHARVYEPGATVAHVVSGPSLRSDAGIDKFGDDWIAWARVILEVTS